MSICYLKKKKVAFRFADIAFLIKTVTGLIQTHVTTKEPHMECAVISKYSKIFLKFQLSQGTGALSRPVIIVLKQNYEKSPKRSM